jgi:hypothetical protein
MKPPEQRCRGHGRTASFVNVHTGQLLCELDERLLRGSPGGEALRPLAEVDLAALRPPAPLPPVRRTPTPVTPSPSLRTETYAGRVGVSYAQVYLRDSQPYFLPPDVQRGGVGLISGQVGCALLVTGLHTGDVDFTVVVATEDPGPDLAFEDIVETDFEARTAHVALEEWGGAGRHALPELPAGPGNYRLRYHGRNLDVAHTSGVVFPDQATVDSYLLQIWRAPATRPAILRVTSRQATYWQSPR